MSDSQRAQSSRKAVEDEGIGARSCPTCGESFPVAFAVCPHDATPLADKDGAHADRLIGAILAGTYRIVEVLGEGGMARLYEAEHLRLESRYAVKVIHDDLSKSPDLLARFEREARAAARIRSDHIVQVIDVLQTPDGRPCMITELLEGEDLQEYLDRVGPLSPARAIPIARKICRALIAAHAGGVVHRDLKPANVFLCSNDKGRGVKVLDFGVAKLSDKSELTKTGAIVGTLAFMAPEQAERASDAGPLADIYTVGAVLYTMLTGQPPYGKDPQINPLVLLLSGPPPPPRAIDSSIPVGVEAVIQRAMARDPEHRPRNAAALDEALAAFDAEAAAKHAAMAGQQSRRTPAGSGSMAPTAERIAREARRARPAALALAASATVLAAVYSAAVLAALLSSGSEPRTSVERTLIVLIALAGGAAVGALLVRALRSRWRSLPAVLYVNRALARTLLAGLITFGGLEILALGTAAASAEPRITAGGWAFRLIAAGAAAALGLLWPRIRRNRQFRRLLD